ncbi:rod shape-determining protein MreD [Sphingobacterium hungaricum]|uniref:Rod shape-determining protein MreD n=1 Tax=Sphingobacterium hungaricum TaxID=2082723 RepID=A0A928V3D1_9SPHI|nr:rod shape-determining protein MreD [Sphingobacterium hungaricum]MBE8715369.1 rod shape-determining protein MreD [Sphingobacterium hungaricum]
MGRILIYNGIRFVVLILLQVVLFKNIGYYNLTSSFPYILFIFLLPIGISNFLLFLIAFLTGLTVDAFYDSIGVHAAACVALAWFRIFFKRITLEIEVRESFDTPTWDEMGFKWFSSYIFFGCLIHHFVLFMVEAFSFKNFHYTLLSTLLSSIFTFLIILLISLLFYKRKSRLISK